MSGMQSGQGVADGCLTMSMHNIEERGQGCTIHGKERPLLTSTHACSDKVNGHCFSSQRFWQAIL